MEEAIRLADEKMYKDKKRKETSDLSTTDYLSKKDKKELEQIVKTQTSLKEEEIEDLLNELRRKGFIIRK